MAATTTADLQVYAERASSAVVYAGYQEPADDGTVRVWVGRATVPVSSGAWQQVSAIGRSASPGPSATSAPGPELQQGGTAQLATFMAAHGGDGSGFYSIGAGCGGGKVSLDTFRVGTASAIRAFDLEGLATSTLDQRHPARWPPASRPSSPGRSATRTVRASPAPPWSWSSAPATGPGTPSYRDERGGRTRSSSTPRAPTPWSR